MAKAIESLVEKALSLDELERPEKALGLIQQICRSNAFLRSRVRGIVEAAVANDPQSISTKRAFEILTFVDDCDHKGSGAVVRSRVARSLEPLLGPAGPETLPTSRATSPTPAASPAAGPSSRAASGRASPYGRASSPPPGTRLSSARGSSTSPVRPSFPRASSPGPPPRASSGRASPVARVSAGSAAGDFGASPIDGDFREASGQLSEYREQLEARHRTAEEEGRRLEREAAFFKARYAEELEIRRAAEEALRELRGRTAAENVGRLEAANARLASENEALRLRNRELEHTAARCRALEEQCREGDRRLRDVELQAAALITKLEEQKSQRAEAEERLVAAEREARVAKGALAEAARAHDGLARDHTALERDLAHLREIAEARAATLEERVTAEEGARAELGRLLASARHERAYFCEKLGDRARRRALFSSLAQTFIAWRLYIENRIERRRAVQLLMRRLARVRLRGALGRWRAAVSESRLTAVHLDNERRRYELEIVKRRAAGALAWRARRRGTAVAFAAWRAFARYRTRKAGLLRAALARWRRRAVAAAMRAWVAWVEARRGRKEAAAGLRLRQAAAAFRAWRSAAFAVRRERRRERGEVAGQRDRGRALVLYHVWLAARRRRLAAVLGSWAARTRELKRVRLFLAARAVRRARFAAAAALARWRRYTAWRLARRALLARAVALLARPAAGRYALGRWRGEAAVERRARLQRALAEAEALRHALHARGPPPGAPALTGRQAKQVELQLAAAEADRRAARSLESESRAERARAEGRAAEVLADLQQRLDAARASAARAAAKSAEWRLVARAFTGWKLAAKARTDATAGGELHRLRAQAEELRLRLEAEFRARATTADENARLRRQLDELKAATLSSIRACRAKYGATPAQGKGARGSGSPGSRSSPSGRGSHTSPSGFASASSIERRRSSSGSP